MSSLAHASREPWPPIAPEGPVGKYVALRAGAEFWNLTPLYGLTSTEYRSACGAVESALAALIVGREYMRNALLVICLIGPLGIIGGSRAGATFVWPASVILLLTVFAALFWVGSSLGELRAYHLDQRVRGALIDSLGLFEATSSRQLVDRVTYSLGLDVRAQDRASNAIQDLHRVGVLQRDDRGLYLFAPAPFATYVAPWRQADARDREIRILAGEGRGIRYGERS